MTTTDPLLIDVPERIETARLLLRPPRPGDGTIVLIERQLEPAETSPVLGPVTGLTELAVSDLKRISA